LVGCHGHAYQLVVYKGRVVLVGRPVFWVLRISSIPAEMVATNPGGVDKMKGNEKVDIGLSVCLAVKMPGETLTQRKIADICGCSRTTIFNIEKSALEKIRQYFKREGIAEDMLI
jgi:predicted DNA-binding protein (UPF0251 family)